MYPGTVQLYLITRTFTFVLWLLDEIACSSPEACNDVCLNPAGCTNIAYPLLVLRILPAGQYFKYKKTTPSNIQC